MWWYLDSVICSTIVLCVVARYTSVLVIFTGYNKLRKCLSCLRWVVFSFSVTTWVDDVADVLYKRIGFIHALYILIFDLIVMFFLLRFHHLWSVGGQYIFVKKWSAYTVDIKSLSSAYIQYWYWGYPYSSSKYLLF